MAKVLIVEDDRGISRFLEIEMTKRGHEVKKAETGLQALEIFEQFRPDVVLLDVMLPEMDGIEVAKEMRGKNPGVGIIMITALGETKDKVTGLNAGADDYVVKPFDTEELVARMDALLRRKNISEEIPMECCGVKLYVSSRRVEVNGKEIELSRKEFDLLEYLMKNKGKVLSKERILEAVWGYDYGLNTVEVYVNYLRKKLGSGIIKTVWGVGYMMREG